MTVLLVPSSAGVLPTGVQFVVAALVLCCNVKSAAGEGHDTASVFVVVRAMVSNGPPMLEYLIVTSSEGHSAPVTNTLPLRSTATALALSLLFPGPSNRFVHKGTPALE